MYLLFSRWRRHRVLIRRWDCRRYGDIDGLAPGSRSSQVERLAYRLMRLYRPQSERLCQTSAFFVIFDLYRGAWRSARDRKAALTIFDLAWMDESREFDVERSVVCAGHCDTDGHRLPDERRGPVRHVQLDRWRKCDEAGWRQSSSSCSRTSHLLDDGRQLHHWRHGALRRGPMFQWAGLKFELNVPSLLFQ